METKYLQHFLVVVDCGSISKAALRLEISQPSLSQQILRLEDEMGQALLTRQTSGVVLTEAGRVFLEHARALIRQLELAAFDLSQLRIERGANITLGLTNSITNLAGHDFYQAVQQRLPSVSVNIIDAMSGRIQEMIETGSVDLGILYDLGAERGILTKEIGQERLFLMASPEFLQRSGFKGKEGLGLEEIAGLPLALPSARHSLRTFIDARMRGAGGRLKVTAEIDVLSLIKTMVAEGTACSILSLGAVWEEIGDGSIVAVEVRGINLSRTIYAARSPHKTITGLLVKTEDVLISTIRQRLGHIGSRARPQ
ncbi:LysR family transcriptional regulator [Roseovarius amoyensis]|uniref:LysR family transcriptional regulator n=1 Tax=Roseovarius amoyensis TaxID=2211448 RepID=UPI000DBEA431|nr:LysR family transcriptional regulator [Roseovarius amoyensis]